jgi:hypothetical protein
MVWKLFGPGISHLFSSRCVALLYKSARMSGAMCTSCIALRPAVVSYPLALGVVT